MAKTMFTVPKDQKLLVFIHYLINIVLFAKKLPNDLDNSKLHHVLFKFPNS